MVQRTLVNKKTAFQCSVCGLKYWEKETAQACEAFCKEHPGTCDPKISEKERLIKAKNPNFWGMRSNNFEYFN